MFKEELSLVPQLSGCYKMINSKGVIIYIGKAKKLRNRLKSYFNGRVTGKTAKMVSEVDHFEYVVTGSEVEAFILELNLIKEYNPKYNILLKDDKTYPYIELTNEKYPKLIVRREVNIKKKHRKLYGPYPNVYAARRMVNLLNRLYPLKKCDHMPKKECLYYHIHECLGYCIKDNIDIESMINEICNILNGRNDILIDKLNKKIEENSLNLNYEKALELKNELDYINIISEKQKVELNDGINRDIFNYYEDNGIISIEVFFLRNGKLVENELIIKPIIFSSKEELEYFIVNFYYKKNTTPKEIIVPNNIDNDLLSSVLDTKVINVQKGLKKKLFDMAYVNAKMGLENNKNLEYKKIEKSNEANEELRNVLGMKSLSVIEAFDNSNLFGTFTVSGMVTFVDGVPMKNLYRKFKISIEQNDDVSSMKEVIYRRYFKLLNEHLPLPDLIIVDGGINQINACKSVLYDLNLNIRLCGLSKDNKHNTNVLIDGSTLEEIKIDKSSSLFLLLSRIGEEVHRYTINYHKQIRSKGSISSLLDEIDGIGEVRKKDLIKKYGSLKKMRELSLEDLEKDLPSKVAINLYNFLKEQ